MNIKISNGMKNKIFSVILSFTLLTTFYKVYAEEIISPPNPLEPINVHLEIKTSNESFFNQDINVSSCESDNPSSGNQKITAYCAVLQSGLSSDWNFAWAPGIFLNSINNIVGFTSKDNDGNDVYHYWSWSLNDQEAQTGLNQYELQAGDKILLNFIDPQPVLPPLIVIEKKHGSSGSYIKKVEEKKIFDTKKGFDFIISKQNENGSFGEDLYTDWTAIALGATTDYQEQKDKLINYYKNLKTENYTLTDYERHTMALMALGIDPQNVHPSNGGVNGENPATDGINYIKKITDSFDGTQFGEIEQVNDDIFALMILQNTGYGKDDKVISETTKYIISKQNKDGSWGGNVDITGAGIESLTKFNGNPDVLNSLNKAKEYLKENQEEDGGFGNISSTAWAIEGILALNEKPIDWIKNKNNPLNYFGENQDKDGGIKEENENSKIWQTSYVLKAISGKTWTEIMQKFEKPIEKIQEIKIKTNDKKEVKDIVPKKQITQNKIPKGKIESKNISASVLNTIETNTKNQEDKNWFRKFINKIFGF